MARALLWVWIVLVETVFQYRTLIGKCELGIGLDWDEIDLLDRIEHVFAVDQRNDGRRFRRQIVTLAGVVRGDEINDSVQIVELGPGGLVIRRAPYVGRGEQIELVIEDGEWSYHFCAAGVWLRDDGDDYKVGLRLVGTPVRLHKVRFSKHKPDIVDKMLVAPAARLAG